MLQLRHPRSITLVCGVSCSGKSTFAIRYLLNVQGVACRFVFDPEGEVASRLKLPAAATAAQLEADLASGWVIFDPHSMFPGRLADAFQFFCEWVFACACRGPGRKICLVDEVWKYCSPHAIPDELALCVQTGRKRGLEMVFCTQRPNRLNEAITNEVSELVCFRLQGENAIDLVEMIGVPKNRVADLPMGTFLALNCDSGRTLTWSIWRTNQANAENQNQAVCPQ